MSEEGEDLGGEETFDFEGTAIVVGSVTERERRSKLDLKALHVLQGRRHRPQPHD